jgi:hypothetical protein
MPIYPYSRNPLKRGIAATLLQKDGDKCQLCGREKIMLEIDHINGDPYDWRMVNLRLLCKNCNLAERNKRSVHERENFSMGIGFELSDETTRAIEKNEDYEPEFRRFIIEMVLRFGPDPPQEAFAYLTRHALINAASNYAGNNPKTGYPYFGKMANPINGFLEVVAWGRPKIKIVRFRFREYYDKTVEEIVKLQPKEGLRFRQDEESKHTLDTSRAKNPGSLLFRPLSEGEAEKPPERE